MTDAKNRLIKYQVENNIHSKGALSVVVQLTRLMREKPFPLNPADFQTGKKGQVKGLGGGNLKKILSEHGISQILSSEGGRTSRGSMEIMIKYAEFLNDWHDDEVLEGRDIDFDEIEEYWANEVREFFRNQPFILEADASKTICANLNDLFAQARKRQSQNPGTQYLGTVLQHLVAAKLSIILPPDSFEIHGASVADSSTDRAGDFVIKDTIIHCTTAPGNPLMEKCRNNIKADKRPVIITIYERVQTALNLAADYGLEGRVEVWDIQQFLSANVYEHSFFDEKRRNDTLARIVTNYNAIIDEKETDPSLRIEFDSNTEA